MKRKNFKEDFSNKRRRYNYDTENEHEINNSGDIRNLEESIVNENYINSSNVSVSSGNVSIKNENIKNENDSEIEKEDENENKYEHNNENEILQNNNNLNNDDERNFDSDNDLFNNSQNSQNKLEYFQNNDDEIEDKINSDEDEDNLNNNNKNENNINEEEEEEEEELKKEIISNRIKLNSSIKNISDLGTIESVELWNFMCHERLRIDFCPRINFVVGHNGSGKSAILTGITVCLGGKATITQRATSLKGLIKEGKNKGSVTIKIRNKGPDAYKHDIYGDRIIIERELRKDGVNGYKIKNSSGRTVATSRKELNHILDHMCIQVDNPMNILNQDLARQFISSSTPEEKYNFFLKGTQLSQLNEDLELVREKIDKIDRIIKLKAEVLPEMKKAIKSKKSEIRDLLLIQNLEKDSNELKKKIVWANIKEKEENINDEEENYKKESKNLNIRINKVKEVKRKLEPFNKKISENREKIKEHTEECNIISNKKKDIEYNLKDVQEKHNNHKRENQKMDMTMKQLSNQKKEFEEKINEEKRKIENMNSNERGRQEDIIKSLNKSIDDLNKKMTEINNDLFRNNKEVVQVGKEKEKYNEEFNSLNIEIDNLKASINKLNSQKKNRVKAFHDSYPEILRIVEEYDKAGKWKEGKPVGPFGMYISIKNKHKEWSKIIETVLKNFVSSMGVFSHDDRKLMQSILTKYKCSAPVFVCRKKKIDFSNGEPEKKFLTVLRAIECSNDVVVQQLIVNARIEQILLIKDRKEADIVMSTGPNNGFPINVAACYTIDGFQVGSKGGYATLSVNLYNGPPKLLTDVDEVIKENDVKINNLIILQIQKNENIQKCKNSISNLQSQSEFLKHQLKEIQSELIKLQSKKMQIQEEMEEKTPEDISTIEKELSSVNNQIDILERQKSELQEQMNSTENEEKKLKDEINEINDLINAHKEEIEKLKNEISEGCAKQMSSLNETLKHYSSEMESQYQNNKILAKKIEELKYSLEEDKKLALQYCERIEVEKSKAELEKELKAIQQQQQIHKNFDRQTITLTIEKYNELKNDFNKAKIEIEKNNEFVKKIKEGVNIRMQRWHKFRTFMSVRAKNMFSGLLSRRGYKGNIEFKHTERQLILKVQIEDQDLLNATGNESYEKDPKSLSGGEKSFSTICLLLSLWQTMSCPIRGLDEFDVFMDAVNRRISMKMLIESARDTAQTQYIMITPQDMSNIQEFGLDSIKIIKMDDPERRRANM